MTPQTKTYTFHIQGMHCKSCVILTESELMDHPGITSARTDLRSHSVEIEGSFPDASPTEIAEELSGLLAKHGYTVSEEKPADIKNWSQFKIAVPLALVFGVFFLALQKMGIVNLIQADTVSYGTAFFIGLIASVSTCMAVVGGLVLSMSATFAKKGGTASPQILFHSGRLLSFFLLGGVIGSLGANFSLGASASFTLGLIIGIIMLILGINLLDIFPSAKKFQPTWPEFLSKHALGVSKWNHTLTPFLVGIATFFLPCGFTQSMQLYTLTTGGFFAGALTMLFFALGTLPVLALISFSSLNITKSPHAGIFFKTAGLIVILFALFNILSSFVIIGLIPPIFNF